MEIFKTGDVSIKENVFSLRDDDGGQYSFLIDENLRNKLEWFALSTHATSMSWKDSDTSLFIGPYIRGVETGAIVQIINLYTRDVYSATVDFKEHTLGELKNLLLK